MEARHPHWVDKIARELAEKRGREKKVIVLNGGLSVSGLQHIGRLRGEVTINDAVAKVLRDMGFRTKQTIVLYTVDPWKGSERQRAEFRDPEEAKKYIGWPLERVPDPHGCHRNWVEHYWEDFGNYLKDFAHDVQVVTTGDLYRNNERMKEYIKRVLELREEVRKVINKYRGRKPFPEGWIPLEPICESCGKITDTEAVAVDVKSWKVEYVCRNCGYRGVTSISNAKLNWRIEWVGIWYVLQVDFEPYGKDHATPGGSRDSAVDLAVNIFGIEPPEGIPYEWVGWSVRGRDMGDMDSSDFKGFTPREWLEVAEAEVLRYYYLVNEPMKRLVVGLDTVYRYVDMYDRAERLYYGVEEPSPKEAQQLHIIKRSFELAQLRPLPKEMPFQLPYLHAVALVQTLPKTGDIVEEAIKRLKATKVLTREPTELDIERIRRRLTYARNWLEKYAPDHYKIKVLEKLTEDIIKSLTPKQAEKLRILLEEFRKVENWTEDEIKAAMMRVPRDSKEDERKFFQAVYLVFFGKPFGPRIAPYLALLGREFVIRRLEEAVKMCREVLGF